MRSSVDGDNAAGHLAWLRSRRVRGRLFAPRVALAIRQGGAHVVDETGQLPWADIELGHTVTETARAILTEVGISANAPLRLRSVHTGSSWFEEDPRNGSLQPLWVVVDVDAPPPTRLSAAQVSPRATALLTPMDFTTRSLNTFDVGGAYIRSVRATVGHVRLFYPWAGAVIRNDDGRLLLVREAASGVWHCPGGGLEIGESLADGAVREVEEETGLLVETDALLGCWSDRFATHPNGDLTQSIGGLLSARVVGGTPRPDKTSEIDDVGWFSREDLPQLSARWTDRIRLAFGGDASNLV